MTPAADTPSDNSSFRVTTFELGARLSQVLTITNWRAVVAVVVAAPSLQQKAEEACRKAIENTGIEFSETIQWTVRRDEAGKEQLRAINQARDTLLQEKKLICLRATDARDIRFLREVAPDLTSAIDLFIELAPDEDSEPDWPTCRKQLQALMEERHGMLDFTGLLPANVEQRMLPLADLYQPLVDPQATERVVEGQTRNSIGLLVLGHPGAGKTTFVRHLAWTYARQTGDPLSIGSKVPLLLSLSDYGYEREHDRVRSLLEFLPRWLAEQKVAQASSLTEHMLEVLLLLDGLDEMRAPEARRSVLVEVSQLLRENKVGGVVVTGRSFLVDELHQEDHALRLVSTREPKQDEIRAFLETFVRLRRGDRAHAIDLVTRIERDTDLRVLARTPLMLAFMAILDELEGRLPDRRIEIYYRLGEMLVNRWTRARSLGTGSYQRDRPTRADALRVLGPLAWWTVERGGGVVPEEALSRELERIEARRETAQEATKRATALLDLLRVDTALLVPRPGRRWSFVHSSVGEYFAGVEVERDRKRWQALLSDPFRPEWREIVLFCAGQLGIIDGRIESLDILVKTILTRARRKGRYDAKYPSLLIGLLEESPGLSRRQIEQLIGRLLELVLTMLFSPTAAEQMQREFVSFLSDARGSVAEILNTELTRWFDSPQTIKWDRLFNAAQNRWNLGQLVSVLPPKTPARFVVRDLITGPFIASIGSNWSRDYGVNLGPTLTLWRRQTHWRYRFAEWVVSSDASARQRPFVDVVRELGLL